LNATTYTPANRFTSRWSLAQACVELLALTPAQQELLVVNDGLPFLAGLRDLGDLADALLDAAQRGLVAGLTHNEDGYPLRAGEMRLDPVSVRAFYAQCTTGAEVPPVLLNATDSAKRLGISRSQFYRELTAGRLQAARAEDGERWRASYLDTFRK
jgi:hypothetical protein